MQRSLAVAQLVGFATRLMMMFPTGMETTFGSGAVKTHAVVVRELGVVAKADDFVVSDNLISLMLSQLSENRELKKVYDVLFQSEGSEIYLKPVRRYVKPGVETDFYNIVASAAELGESAIGYRVTAESHDSERQFGVHLNPNKSHRVTFAENDFIIVLSED